MKMKMEKRTTKVVQIKKGCTFFCLGGSLPENGETSPRNNNSFCLLFTFYWFLFPQFIQFFRDGENGFDHIDDQVCQYENEVGCKG